MPRTRFRGDHGAHDPPITMNDIRGAKGTGMRVRAADQRATASKYQRAGHPARPESPPSVKMPAPPIAAISNVSANVSRSVRQAERARAIRSHSQLPEARPRRQGAGLQAAMHAGHRRRPPACRSSAAPRAALGDLLQPQKPTTMSTGAERPRIRGPSRPPCCKAGSSSPPRSGYIGLLFVVASYGDRAHRRARVRDSRWRHLIYPLSLAIYCTSWTFFGSVGLATRTGF